MATNKDLTSSEGVKNFFNDINEKFYGVRPYAETDSVDRDWLEHRLLDRKNGIKLTDYENGRIDAFLQIWGFANGEGKFSRLRPKKQDGEFIFDDIVYTKQLTDFINRNGKDTTISMVWEEFVKEKNKS